MYLAPATGFLDWTSEQWDAFFEGNPESVCLGKSGYVGWVLAAISHNLEGDAPGSQFPLLMRMESSDPLGWYADEVPQLIRELGQLKMDLGALAITRSTLNCEKDDQVQQRIDDFRRAWPGRPVRSVYDLHFYYFEEFEKLARKAIELRQGLFVTF